MAFFLRGLSSFIFGGQPSATAESPLNGQPAGDEERLPAPARAGTARNAPPSQQAEPSMRGRATTPPQATTLQLLLSSSSSEAAEERREQPPPYRSADYDDRLAEASGDEESLDEHMADSERRHSLLLTHFASLPEHRFDEQVEREEVRLLEKWAACNLKKEYWLEGSDLTQLAMSVVQRRWEDQGIAKEYDWFGGPSPEPSGFWKHQEIREDHGPREVCRLDSSRPFFQFMQEVSAERDHLEFIAYPPLLPSYLITHAPQVLREPTPDDLHTAAYYNVRYDQWTAKGIWDPRWGEMPGMFWRHESDVRAVFLEVCGSLDNIPQRHLDMSDRLPERQSFQRRRVGILSHLPKMVEVQLRRGEYEDSIVPENRHPTANGQPASNHAEAGSSGSGSPQDPRFTVSASARTNLPEGSMSRQVSQDALVGTESWAIQRGDISGSLSEARFGRAELEHHEDFSGDDLEPGQMASSEDGSYQGSFSDPSPLVTDQAQQPLSAARRPLGLSSGRMTPIPEQSTPSETSSEGEYGDENSEDPLDAIRRQLLDVQRSAQQVLDAHKALAAQVAAVQSSRAQRRATTNRGNFSKGPPHQQRRVLGPLPSTHRVSKKRAAPGKMVTRSIETPAVGASPASSEASTVIFAPLRSPSPAKHDDDHSAEHASSHEAPPPLTDSFVIRQDSPEMDNNSPRDEGFVIREDTPQDAEGDVSMEEPRIELSPQARARQRRRATTERRALQPLRRSKRNILAR
ncbi:hypothetical protein V2A60_002034 [Cordyceps javanica]|uniref:Uncharacterized protein n=1 Tax=Cordyceps javanica TaxID=43265 RepID=A0A545VH52_9HYPO|nr:hypothetical protein IF1G_00947 [Cordyceps javanica]TQW12175.1 hypothetical protein IF2G_00906 [Cordyceps javanica]